MSDDYYRLRSPEIATLVAADRPVMVCLGATEQHGPHLPLGTDTYQVEGLARAAIAQLRPRGVELVLGPTIPFGPRQFQAEAPVDFPGTINISNQLLYLLTKEVCAEVARHGFKRIYILIGNAESDAAAQLAAKELSEAGEAVFTTVNWMVVLSELYSGRVNFKTPQGHGGAGETARLLALFPETVDMPSARAFHPRVKASGISRDALPYLGGGVGRFKYPCGCFGEDFRGIVGDPHEGTAEIGHQLNAIIGGWIADVVAFEEEQWTKG